MNKLSKWLRAWFPTVKPYREEADKILQEVKEAKTLSANGDMEWFINKCKNHKDEVCDDSPIM
jgi:hypothetical protein